MKKSALALVLSLALPLPTLAAEESAGDECPDWKAQTLTGDWGGLRADLCKKGISLEISHKSDVMSNVSGGIKRGTVWLGHTEARIKLNLEKLLGWDATSAYIHYHSQLGSKFNRDYVGSFVGSDNIETSVNTAQFSQAWVQKSFFDDGLSVLAGLYAIDSEFYVTDTSGVFIQPPYGMANDLAQTGRSGPPIFPLGALALRFKYTTPGKDFYLQGAVADGVPGDPKNPRGTHIKLAHGDGALSIVEFGYTPQESAAPAAQPGGEEAERFNKTAIGIWRYTVRFDDLSDVDADGNPLRRKSQGYYFLTEHSLLTEAGHPSQGLAGFLRFGTANKDLQQADWTGSAGLRYHGLFDGRDDDIAGIALTYNHASAKYRLANNAESNQTNVEATYRAQIKSWLALQPTVQYIRNPNMDITRKNAVIVGARAEISF